jgi:uncharacterized delta-60 repeat protein
MSRPIRNRRFPNHPPRPPEFAMPQQSSCNRPSLLAGNGLAMILALAIAIAGVTRADSACARDGDLDPQFAGSGSLLMPFPGNLAIASAFQEVVALADGRLLVAATVETGAAGAADFGVLRLLGNGSLDSGFGQGGARLVAFDRPGGDNTDTVRDLLVQPDGSIVLVGDAAGGLGGIDMAVARVLANGSLDLGFGSGGKTTIAFDLGSSPARRADQGVAITRLPDGRLVVAGQVSTAAGALMGVARLHANGSLDPSFDGDGKATANFGGGLSDVALAYDVVVAADGESVFGIGAASLAGNLDFAIAKWRGDGSPDPEFGTAGSRRFGFDVGGSLNDAAVAGRELADGRLMLCGAASVALPANADIACIRLLATGGVDPAFVPALVPFDLGGSNIDEALEMAVDGQGRIVLAGQAASPAATEFALVRLLASGQVDPAFGVDGRRSFSAPTGPDLRAQAWGLTLQADGSIVLAGGAETTLGGPNHLYLVRAIGDTLAERDFEVIALQVAGRR